MALPFAVLLGVLAALVSLTPEAGPSDSRTVIVAALPDLTGNPRLALAIEQALVIQLAQSPHLHVVRGIHDERTGVALVASRTTAGAPAESRPGPCDRDPDAILVDAAAGRDGVVTLRAARCRSGAMVATREVDATSADDVLRGAGEAALVLAADLAGRWAARHGRMVPLDRAATGSVDALAAYAAGERLVSEGSDGAAVQHYARALTIDRGFALAHARLAAIYERSGSTELARRHRTSAYELRDRASEIDRFEMTADYYRTVTGEIDKARSTYAAWTRRYPNDPVPHTALAALALITDRPDDAIDSAGAALARRADSPRPYAVLGHAYLRLWKLDEAEAILRRAIDRGLSDGSIRRGLYLVAEGREDRATAQRLLEEARGTADEPLLLALAAGREAAAGRLRAARSLFVSASDAARRLGQPAAAGAVILESAIVEAAFGETDRARAEVSRARAIWPEARRDGRAGLVLALAGDLPAASSVADALAERSPDDTLVNSLALPSIRAAIDLQQRRAERAVDRLRLARPYELGSGFPPYLAPYLRAQAFLRSNRTALAAAEFRRILAHPGVGPGSPFYPLARLGLARALALSRRPVEARAVYRDLLEGWRGADSDLPALGDALREMRALRGSSPSPGPIISASRRTPAGRPAG